MVLGDSTNLVRAAFLYFIPDGMSIAKLGITLNPRGGCIKTDHATGVGAMERHHERVTNRPSADTEEKGSESGSEGLPAGQACKPGLPRRALRGRQIKGKQEPLRSGYMKRVKAFFKCSTPHQDGGTSARLIPLLLMRRAL